MQKNYFFELSLFTQTWFKQSLQLGDSKRRAFTHHNV